MTGPDFFDRTETRLCAGMRRDAHKPRHVRFMRRMRRRPALGVMIAALILAAPAIGAVTNWYGLGAPNHPASEAQAYGVGNALPGTARLLPLRIPDPQGGPPWGIRIVATQHGSCQEIGRIANGQLGSLGIDGYWHNDRLFHPFPANWVGESCGSSRGTPGSGAGGSGADISDASANIPTYRHGKQTDGCTIERGINPTVTTGRPACPPRSLRIVMFASLGPRAKSITYRAPDGKLHTEASAGKYGTVLLVLPLDAETCRTYLNKRYTKNGSCIGRLPNRTDRLSTPLSIAIRKINLANGKSCRVTSIALSSNCPELTNPHNSSTP